MHMQHRAGSAIQILFQRYADPRHISLTFQYSSLIFCPLIELPLGSIRDRLQAAHIPQEISPHTRNKIEEGFHINQGKHQ